MAGVCVKVIIAVCDLLLGAELSYQDRKRELQHKLAGMLKKGDEPGNLETNVTWAIWTFPWLLVPSL